MKAENIYTHCSICKYMQQKIQYGKISLVVKESRQDIKIYIYICREIFSGH